jgi:hypothetical protein
MKTWHTPSVLLLSLAVMLPISTRAQSNSSADSLRGIKSVFVLLEELPLGANKIDLTKDSIQTDVELKLRLAGLKVLPATQVSQAEVPVVYVTVNLTDDASAASVTVQIAEDALLARNAQPVADVFTWQRSIVIARPSADGIREDVKDLTDSFLNDWLSVNPKN